MLPNLKVFATLLATSLPTNLRAEPVDPRLATLILQDARLVRFVGVVEKAYPVSCDLPTTDRLEAEENCVGSGDFRSCYYKFLVSCGAFPGEGPHDLMVNAEYFPLGNFILNLEATVGFRK